MRGGLLPQLPLQLLDGVAVLGLEVRHVGRELAPRQALLLCGLLHRRLHALVVMARLLARPELGHLISVLREREGVPELERGPLRKFHPVVLLDGLDDVLVLWDSSPEPRVHRHLF